MDDGKDEDEGHERSLSQQNPALLQPPPNTNPPGPSNPPKQLVWLIFGATGHMGRSVARAALSHNDKVCAVGRTFENSLQSMQSFQGNADNFLGLLCDVRIRETVRVVI